MISTGERDKALALELNAENRLLLYLYLSMADESIRTFEMELEHMKQTERSKYPNMKNHPVFDFLRSNPRFQKIIDAHKMI